MAHLQYHRMCVCERLASSAASNILLRPPVLPRQISVTIDWGRASERRLPSSDEHGWGVREISPDFGANTRNHVDMAKCLSRVKRAKSGPLDGKRATTTPREAREAESERRRRPVVEWRQPVLAERCWSVERRDGRLGRRGGDHGHAHSRGSRRRAAAASSGCGRVVEEE